MPVVERSTMRRKSGFTLVELSLSVAFIAILSIIIVLIINNTISSYRRGLTLNKINTVGMDLVDDIRAAVQNSSPRNLLGNCATLYKDTGSSSSDFAKCEADGAVTFVSVAKKAGVTVGGKNIGTVPVYGAFCTGAYSYIWNSGYFFGDDSKVADGVGHAQLRYKNASNSVVDYGTSKPFKLIKIEDMSRAVCIGATSAAGYNNAKYGNIGNMFDVSGSLIVESEPIDLLTGDTENDLALYDLWSGAPASNDSSDNLFYNISMILGTIQGGMNVAATGNFCAAPSDTSGLSDLDYCAINKFNFAVQATGE